MEAAEQRHARSYKGLYEKGLSVSQYQAGSLEAADQNT